MRNKTRLAIEPRLTASAHVLQVWDQISGTSDSSPVDSQLCDAVGNLLRAGLGGPAKRVLDLGGGAGNPALGLSAAGYEVTVVDSDEGLLETARRRSQLLGAEIEAVGEDWATFLRRATEARVVADAVLVLGNALAYQDSWPERHPPSGAALDRLVPTLMSIRRVMAPSGFLLLEIAVEDDLETSYVRLHPGSGGSRSLAEASCTSLWIVENDASQGVRLVDTILLDDLVPGRARVITRVRFRCYLLTERLLAQLAADSGFTISEVPRWPRPAFRAFRLTPR